MHAKTTRIVCFSVTTIAAGATVALHLLDPPAHAQLTGADAPDVICNGYLHCGHAPDLVTAVVGGLIMAAILGILLLGVTPRTVTKKRN